MMGWFKREFDEYGAGPEEEQMPTWFHVAGNILLVIICLLLSCLVIYAVYAEFHR